MTDAPGRLARAREVVEQAHHDVGIPFSFSNLPPLPVGTFVKCLVSRVAAFADAEVAAVVNPRACQECEGEDCERCGGTGFYCVGCATYTRAADMWQALLAEARAQGSRPSADRDEVAWLIEYPSRRGSAPLWWDGRGSDTWTADSLTAVRFTRKEDAEAVIRFSRPNNEAVRMVEAIATEHLWVAPASADRDEGPQCAAEIPIPGGVLCCVGRPPDHGKHTYWITEEERAALSASPASRDIEALRAQLALMVEERDAWKAETDALLEERRVAPSEVMKLRAGVTALRARVTELERGKASP